LGTDDPELGAALEAPRTYLADELLATRLTLNGGQGETVDVDGRPLQVDMRRA